MTDPIRDDVLELLGWVPGALRVGDVDAGLGHGPYDLAFTADAVARRAALEACLPSVRYAVAIAPVEREGLQGLPIVFWRELADGRWAHVVRGGRVRASVPFSSPEELLRPCERQPSLADLDLKILVGGSSIIRTFAGDYYDPDRIKSFGEGGAADIEFSLADETFSDVLAKLPEGWVPDVVLFFFPEYFALPAGFAQSPIPTVGLISDWNVAFSKLAPCLGLFDLVLADWAGSQIFRALGMDSVHYAPLYSFEPAVHRPLDEPKFLDVAFLGNLNHRIQRSRTRFLGRVAELSSVYQVFVGGGLYGEEYARTLAGARIVFNHSVRGELNLRCYEAPACGSLLFLERDNLEARLLLRDGLDCVLYGEDNLEELLDHYLASHAEREAITRSGRERVLQSSYTAHFSGIVGLLRQFLAHPRGPRAFAELPEAERLGRLARLAVPSQEGRWYDFAIGLLLEAAALEPQNGDIASDLAALLAIRANGSDAECEAFAPEARARFEQALGLLGEDPVLLLSYGAFLLSLRDPAAFSMFVRAWSSEAPAVPRLSFHEPFSTFNAEMDRLCAQHTGRPETLQRELGRLVRWQATTWLARASSDPSDKKVWLEQAVELCPSLHESRTLLGQTLLHFEDHEGAIAQFKAAIEDNPFDVEAQTGLAKAYEELGAGAEALALRLKMARMTRGLTRLGPGPVEPDAIAIEGLRATNFLCPLEDRSDLALLESFVDRFSADDDVALVVYSRSLEPAVAIELVEACLEAQAVAAKDVPDIVVLDHTVTPSGEFELRSRFAVWEPATA